MGRLQHMGTFLTGTHEPEGLAEVEGPDCQKPSSPMVMRWLGSACRKCAATVLIHDCPHTQGCSGACPVTACLGLASDPPSGQSWYAILQAPGACRGPGSVSEALELERIPRDAGASCDRTDAASELPCGSPAQFLQAIPAEARPGQPVEHKGGTALQGAKEVGSTETAVPHD